MKNLGAVILLFLILAFVGFFYSQKNSLNNNRILPTSFTGEVLSSEERDEVVINTPTVTDSGITQSGQHLVELNEKFGSLRDNSSSYREKYATYVNNKSYFIELIEKEGDDIYKNSGIDIYPSLFYLCSIIEGSMNETELKKNLIKGKKIVLVSTSYTGAAVAYGSNDLITQYNKTIEKYILSATGGYADFYSGVQSSAQAIFSAKSTPQVKSIGEVVVGIYGLGNQKFVEGKSINCAKDMELLFSGKNLNP